MKVVSNRFELEVDFKNSIRRSIFPDSDWVKTYLRVALQGLNAGLVLVIPDLDEPVVCTADEVRLVAAMVVVHAVHALLVTVQGKVGRRRAQLPDLVRDIKLNCLFQIPNACH